MKENIEKVVGTTLAVVGITTISWATVHVLNKISRKVNAPKI